MHRNAATMQLLRGLILDPLIMKEGRSTLLADVDFTPQHVVLQGKASQAFNGWQFSLAVLVSVVGC